MCILTLPQAHGIGVLFINDETAVHKDDSLGSGGHVVARRRRLRRVTWPTCHVPKCPLICQHVKCLPILAALVAEWKQLFLWWRWGWDRNLRLRSRGDSHVWRTGHFKTFAWQRPIVLDQPATGDGDWTVPGQVRRLHLVVFSIFVFIFVGLKLPLKRMKNGSWFQTVFNFNPTAYWFGKNADQTVNNHWRGICMDKHWVCLKPGYLQLQWIIIMFPTKGANWCNFGVYTPFSGIQIKLN